LANLPENIFDVIIIRAKCPDNLRDRIAMETVYMDESGYTGYDLLNATQPFQAASSLIIDEKTAQSLIDETFPRRRAKELKHKKLSKYKSYWEPLLEIQKIILNDFYGLTYVCNKKYFLILQFLDDCVEPFFYQNGINFFKDGQNYALASLLYCVLSASVHEK